MKSFLACVLMSVVPVACAHAVSTMPAPTRHGDFAHYTFALTWQPGFCQTGQGCAADQPRDVYIGLHGLWASRPRDLIAQGIAAPQWWRRGCDFYHHSDLAPRLSASTQQTLDHVMPHLRHSLLTHEYDKHVQCFDFAAEAFFRAELRLRQDVVDSAFGHYLISQRGHPVEHRRVTGAFMHAFGTSGDRVVQLRCESDPQHGTVLTQIWITLRADAVDRFPGRGALADAPIAQDNCPASFFVPDWPSGNMRAL